MHTYFVLFCAPLDKSYLEVAMGHLLPKTVLRNTSTSTSSSSSSSSSASSFCDTWEVSLLPFGDTTPRHEGASHFTIKIPL